MMENVRNISGLKIDEIAKHFIDREYDDTFDGWYTGKVTNNNDPDKDGKCQIRIYGVFDDVNIHDDDLPWALPDMSFIGGLKGSFIVPPVGAIVKVYFDRNDIYLPHYSTKALDKRNQSTLKTSDYPDTMVFFETDYGDSFTINRKTNVTTFTHKSGTTATISPDGSVSFNVVGKVFKSEGADIADLSGKESVNLNGNFAALYCKIPGLSAITDLSLIGISPTTKVDGVKAPTS